MIPGWQRRRVAPTPPLYEAGTATIVAIIVSLLLGAIGVGAWTVTRSWLLGAQRRLAHAEARELARSSARAIGGWFERDERGSLTEPPLAADVDRSLRAIDLDGDGRGTHWPSAGPPWDARYKESGGALFRPPDDGAPEDAFAGTPAGPDVVISRIPGEEAGTSAVLDILSRALEPAASSRVVRVALFRPADRAGAHAIATVEAVAERALPGSPPVLVRVRADVVRVPWGRSDRPVVVERDAVFQGEAGWRFGEALIQGELTAGGDARDGWPGGIPWLAPDRPLRDDADGDGSADDADGDGSPDLASWRALPGAVPDPWWRARVGGAWTDLVPAPAPCEQPFPFGPRRSPAEPASKGKDRSGLFVGCPLDAPVRPVVPAWRDLARLGARGVWVVTEVPDQPGHFALDGSASARPLDDWLPRQGGVAWLLARDLPDRELEIAGDGIEGALIVENADVTVRAGGERVMPVRIPGDPADTNGAPRRAAPDDVHLVVTDDAGDCDGWSVGDWVGPGEPPPRLASHPCPDRALNLNGLLVVGRGVTVVGPWRQSGQIRSRRFAADGRFGSVRIDAQPASLDDAAARPGPPGAPRVVVIDLRQLP